MRKTKVSVVLMVAVVVLLCGCGAKKESERLMEFISPGESMENTILQGETVSFDRNAYKDNSPERYDVVLFKWPDNPNEKFIGRIIGLPGETITIQGGKAYAGNSDEPLDDSFCPEEPVGDFGPYEVPEDAYFVLGDNRNYSKDSRFWENKYVPEKDILGKAQVD